MAINGEEMAASDGVGGGEIGVPLKEEGEGGDGEGEDSEEEEGLRRA